MRRCPGRASVEQGRGIRTALTVQARDGLLYVYLPPLTAAEDWLALVAAIEQTAAALGSQCVLEGYKPPYDRRLESFSVTPDPGVIEVNVQPAASWDEIVQPHRAAVRGGPPCGLRAEKFMLDGRHVGTGGGNHVVMGAATPEDSPFLRRPDLLRSLLGFWHNHPSLSYLFSGLFIGPMSQHPRIDEARQDAVRELEIAFAQVKRGRARPRLDHRPAVPQHPGRHDGQHPPHRVLHRQDVLAGQLLRPARPGGVPRLRDAAARRDGRRPDAADAHRRRRVLAGAVRAPPGALGHPGARRLHAAALRLAGLHRRAGGAGVHGAGFGASSTRPGSPRISPSASP